METLWPPGFRRKKTDDIFFNQGNDFCFLDSKKYICVLEDELENIKTAHECREGNCNNNFPSSFLFQLHYDTHHRNTCSLCHLILPSNHLLDLHISERHHSLFDGPNNQFKCAVVGCMEVFQSEASRKSHLTTSHGYPSNYRYLHCLGSSSSKNKSNNNNKISRNVNNENNNINKYKEMNNVDNKDNSFKEVNRTDENNNSNRHNGSQTSNLNSKVDNNNNNDNNMKNKNNNTTGDEEMEVEDMKEAASNNARIPKNICFGNRSKKCFQRKYKFK